jgi:hypothetical protein
MSKSLKGTRTEINLLKSFAGNLKPVTDTNSSPVLQGKKVSNK